MALAEIHAASDTQVAGYLGCGLADQRDQSDARRASAPFPQNSVLTEGSLQC